MRKALLLATTMFCLPFLEADAATTPNSVVAPQVPNRAVQQFLQGTDAAGTYKTVYTAGSNGSRCYALWTTNNDSGVTHLLTLQLVNGGIKYGGVAITSVESAGFANAAPAQNLLAPTNWPGLPLDTNGNPYIAMVSGDTLQMTFATTLSAAAVINVTGVCSDF